MEFSIGIPYRKIIFQINVAEPVAEEKICRLAEAVRRAEIERQVARDIARHQERYFLFK